MARPGPITALSARGRRFACPGGPGGGTGSRRNCRLVPVKGGSARDGALGGSVAGTSRLRPAGRSLSPPRGHDESGDETGQSS
jgi:hypothetical protein